MPPDHFFEHDGWSPSQAPITYLPGAVATGCPTPADIELSLGEASPTVLLEGLLFPGGVAAGPDGAVYLTNFGLSATAGEVLRLDVAPCS